MWYITDPPLQAIKKVTTLVILLSCPKKFTAEKGSRISAFFGYG
jgi:hypothetical protein